MTNVESLKVKRASAKGYFTRAINDLETTVSVTGDDMFHVLTTYNEDKPKIAETFQNLVAAHNAYVDLLLTETTSEKVDEIVDREDAYLRTEKLRKVEIDKKCSKFEKAFTEAKEVKEAADAVTISYPDLKSLIQKYKSLKLEADNFQEKYNGSSVKDLVENDDAKGDVLSAADTRKQFLSTFHKLVEANNRLVALAKKANIALDQVFLELNFKVDEATCKEYYEAKRILDKLNSAYETLKPAAASASSMSSSPNTNNCPIKLSKIDNIDFSGEYRDFATFKKTFVQLVVSNRKVDDPEIGVRLVKAMPAKHKHLIENLDYSDYVGMMKILTEKFGKSQHIIGFCMKDIDKIKTPIDDESFIKFVESIEKVEKDLASVSLEDRLDHELMLTKIESRLPEKVKFRWREVKAEAQDDKSFKDLLDFLKKYKNMAEEEITSDKISPTSSKTKTSIVTGKTFTVSSIEKQKPEKNRPSKLCLACNDGSTNLKAADHLMETCEVWNSLSNDEKKKLVKCVKHPWDKSHETKDCQRDLKYPCKHCKNFNHHYLLCFKKNSRSNKASCKSSSSSDSDILLKTLIVGTNKPNVNLGVMEDNCSTDNYITFSAAKKLKLKGPDVVLEIEGINSTKLVDSKIFKVPICDKENHLHFVECYGLKEIAKDSVPPSKVVYQKLCKLLDVDPKTVERPGKIDLLLSARSNHLMSDEVIKSKDGVKLYRGPLGETLSGTFCDKNSKFSKAYPTKVTPVISSVKRASVIRSLTDNEILKYFKEESIGAECNPKCGSCQCGKCPLGSKPMSIKEEKEYNKFLENMFLDVDGTFDDPGPYWRTKYPWNIPKEELIDNYEAVLGVMNVTTKKLNKDPEWRRTYEQQLLDLTANKFSREVSEKELFEWIKAGNKHYYIAHQMALNSASKSTPIRTVFNSSQVYKGYSLNSSWDLGPDMTNNLHGVLMRFRENVVGAQGDIKKMYYNVRVTKEEEFMQLYIWRFSGEDKIRIFAMTRLVMGNKPSANCSQIALKETAKLNENLVQYPIAFDALTNNSYVSFTVADNIAEIKSNINQIELVAAQGGFNYKPWIVSGEDVDVQQVAAPSADDPEKALGVFWMVKEDKFFIKVAVGNKKKQVTINLMTVLENPKLKLTVRNCLSLHSKAFDPIGLDLPTKMIGALLFRKTLQILSSKSKAENSTSKNRLP